MTSRIPVQLQQIMPVQLDDGSLRLGLLFLDIEGNPRIAIPTDQPGLANQLADGLGSRSFWFEPSEEDPMQAAAFGQSALILDA